MPPICGFGGLALYPPKDPFMEGRAELPAPAVAFGRQGIATGSAGRNRVLRITPYIGAGSLWGANAIVSKISA